MKEFDFVLNQNLFEKINNLKIEKITPIQSRSAYFITS